MEKKILEKYIESLSRSLMGWVDKATNLKIKISASENIVPFELHGLLRQINYMVNDFKERLKLSYTEYQDIEKTYGLKPLSIDYMLSFSGFAQQLEKALGEVKNVGAKYSQIVEMSKEYPIDVNKYVSVKNQKTIDRIQTLTTEKLLDMLNDMYLLEF